MANDRSSIGINTAFAGNRYFNTATKNFNFLGFTSTPYVYLKPKGSGVVDVYNTMYWSNLGNKSEVPQITIREKELLFGTWATQLANLLTQGEKIVGQLRGNNNEAIDVYALLYSAKDTGFYYNFPWLLSNGSSLRNIENTWKTTQGLGDFFSTSTKNAQNSPLASLFGAAIGAAVGTITPGFGFEDTKQYESTSQQSVTVSFPLYNTIDLESAFNHFSFVNLFTFQSLKTRTSLMTFIPPKIYEIDAYSVGGIYMAAAIVSNLKIESIGTTRRMKEWESFGSKEILIPEAYKVSITFQDLLSQSSNVFAGALGGTKVQVISDDVNPFITAGAQGIQNLNIPDAFQGAVQGINNALNPTQNP